MITTERRGDSMLELRDGTTILLRPMSADDADRLVRFHLALSPESQYLRFFSGHPRLSASEVDLFTHVNHRSRDAVVALLDGEIVGVGRFDRLPGGDDAEVAFVVADRLHGLGLGTALLRWVATRAAQVGIGRLVAETLPTNHGMLRVFRHLGAPMSCHFGDGVVHVTLAPITR